MCERKLDVFKSVVWALEVPPEGPHIIHIPTASPTNTLGVLGWITVVGSGMSLSEQAGRVPCSAKKFGEGPFLG